MFQKILFLTIAMMASTVKAVVPKINVRIAKSQKEVLVHGFDMEQILIGERRPKIYMGVNTLRFNCVNQEKPLKNSRPVLISRVSSKTGLLDWEDKKYRGNLSIVASTKGRGCDLVNEMPLDFYISTLLAKEMNPNWPIEALKAQAVAARSYAYHKIITKQVNQVHGHETYYHLENSEKHQVNGSVMDTTRKTAAAATQTKGEILLLPSGKVTPIFFHSKCGGKTLTPDQVWENKIEGYQSVNCPYCNQHGLPEWEKAINTNSFKDYMKQLFQGTEAKKSTSEMKIMRSEIRQNNVRVYEEANPYLIKKASIRNVVGRKLAPSNYFTIAEEGNKIILRGKGFGHGVGMCQFGAYELAKRGYTYKQILAHYFPGHKIEKIY